MDNKQQTAVERFGIEIGKLFAQYHARKINIIEFHLKRFELEEQAKEMQKQRMIEFAKKFIDVVNIEDKDIEYIYEQTYGENN